MDHATLDVSEKLCSDTNSHESNAELPRIIRVHSIKIRENSCKQGQVLIETSLFFIAIILLLLMVVRIWVWSNNQVVIRQLAYNNSRVEAGTVAPSDRAAPLIWTIENTPRGDRQVSNPEELSSGWMFRGQ